MMSVPGSGTRCRFKKANTGMIADGARLVLTNTGDTRLTVPEGYAVFEKGAAPPMCETVPTATVPVVQGAPITVRFTSPCAVTKPPTPTTPSGTWRFATEPEHGPNRQTFATPLSGMTPPKRGP